MDRRQVIGALGGFGVGLGLETAVGAEGHGKPAADAGPMTGPHAHFCGIHMAKNNPKLQFITQHYCAAHSETDHDGMFQCVLFDSTGKNAKLALSTSSPTLPIENYRPKRRSTGTRTPTKCSVAG